MNRGRDEIKIGDWVRIISNESNNILKRGYREYTVGKVFEVRDIYYGFSTWVYPMESTDGWAIDARSLERYNKHDIVQQIINDL